MSNEKQHEHPPIVSHCFVTSSSTRFQSQSAGGYHIYISIISPQDGTEASVTQGLRAEQETLSVQGISRPQGMHFYLCKP